MEHNSAYFNIGMKIPRVDAYGKATGKEKYAADYYGERFLWAGIKRAGVPHALLKDIHTEKAKELPGVYAVLTSRDIPGTNRTGLIYQDQPVLADKKICHCGEPLALVLAENKEILMQAIQHISFDYESLPGIFDAEEAIGEDAPRVHEDHPGGNIIRAVSVETGAGSEALKECDIVVEGVFNVPMQEHAYLETETGWAYRKPGGEIVIVASTQTPFRDRFEIAPVLGIDAEKIRVIAPYLGGAFGGKDGVTVQCYLGLAVLHSQGRPVKMWWSREESFMAGVKRLPARMYYRLGAKADGELLALECRLYYDGGAYASLGGEIMTLGAEHAGLTYRIPNVSIKGWCLYTNNPLGGPFRGFGVPQSIAAMEQMIDILAAKVCIDPVELRLKNIVHRGDRNCVGVTLTNSVGAARCLETISAHSLWKDRDKWKKEAGPDKIRGTGIACMAHAMGYPPVVPDQATAKIEITGNGRIKVYAGVTDMGQGNAGTYAQIAGHILKQDPASMELVLPDTSRTLPSGSSSASRTTYTYGNAMMGAAQKLSECILKQASLLIEKSKTDDFTLAPGCVIHMPSGREIPLSDIALLIDKTERVCTSYFRMPTVREKLDTIYMGPHLIYSYGAHLAYVEIDRLTGSVEVKAYVAATDAGKVLNPQIYEQQIQGAIAQGIGYALTEHFKTFKGRILTENLATYTIPASMDVPEITSLPVETEEETGPFGMKGVGEIATSGPLPAIANAIADGCGARIWNAPFTGEKVLAMMKNNERSPR